MQGTDGNFYGTTGQFGGTVFKVTPDGTLTTLYFFCSLTNCADGEYPTTLVQGTDGNFYGATYAGGTSSSNCNLYSSNGCGTVFKITPQGTLTTLHLFDGADGCYPQAGLVRGTDGNFYGTTGQGGTHGFCGPYYGNGGTIFKITPGGTLTTLYNFGGTDGSLPYGELVQATDGSFYGTTNGGGTGSHCDGSGGCGTAFKITPAGTLTTLYNFCSQTNCADGILPYGKLVQATDGNFYGTTYEGGAHQAGTVFSLDAGLNVTLTVTTVGSGTVTSSDGYINCGPTCSYVYASGTQVILTATPAQGWLFGAWSGCDATNNSVCTVTMNSARNVTATFVPAELLSVTVAGSGTVVSGAINCGSVCSHLYKQGTQVKLTAVPGAGSTLSSWTGCDTMQGDFCTVTMSGARNVTATFMSVQVSLTSLVLNPDSVKGGQTSIATLTLGAAAPPGGLGVGISSDNPRVAHPPSLVVVPGGAISTQFAVRTSPVRQKTVVKITASDNTSQTSAMLTVDPR